MENSLMPNILAIETATEACSAALLIDGKRTARFAIAPRQHTDLILPMIDELLHEARLSVCDLDAITYGAGPGSFTGVRVATSITQGLALAHDIPVIALSCLEILAIGAARTHQCVTVATVMDARKAEIYWAVYAIEPGTGRARCLVPDTLCRPEEFVYPNDRHCVVVGSGCKLYRDQLIDGGVPIAMLMDDPIYPHAIDALDSAQFALHAGQTIAAEFAAPIYLRNTL
ncbi:MAG: tRNA (adenosine(37)-N6)-threonylcarbamoyltransferase complex dimerization subunit type 1 TsaB [Proteobacteria bacterium]|nr:tRNA (adenosine(37)-N6)-threonylcarbamoyltransferase complex dimerization subunit type 1 TsaB [Pseudomonadota bacterium]